MDAPKKIVSRFFRRWPLEASNSRTLRIENVSIDIVDTVITTTLLSNINLETGRFFLSV
jgi:hypothetical protein